jgi:muramoyltetrapeptide carboxypeptidase
MLNNQVVATVCPGEAKGHAIGGNLHVFMSLIGTPYLPETKGAILFIEDTGATGHHLYGMLQHLKLAGILENLNGVVVGEYVERPDVEDAGDNSVEQVLVEFFKDGPPCISGLNFSHGDFNAVIPIGAPTFLDANNRIVEFDFNML